MISAWKNCLRQLKIYGDDNMTMFYKHRITYIGEFTSDGYPIGWEFLNVPPCVHVLGSAVPGCPFTPPIDVFAGNILYGGYTKYELQDIKRRRDEARANSDIWYNGIG